MNFVKTSKFLVGVILLCFFASCSKNENEPPIQTGETILYTTSPIDLQGIDAKFAEHIAYDDKDRTQFDIFLPNSQTPTALVVYIHGGGFVSGDKDFPYNIQKGGAWDFPTDIRTFLSNNIAFASIRYRLFDSQNETTGVLKPMNDVKRALQYLRYRADDFNLDKDKVVITGNSAGGGTSLWIGFSDDMKDETNADPVLRESTKVKGISIRNTQATYNLDKWETDVFIDFGLDLLTAAASNSNFEKTIKQFYGLNDINEYNSTSTTMYKNDVDMLALMDANDPELWVENILFENGDPGGDKNIINHHPFHARELRERADAVGLPIVAYYGDPILFQASSGETWTEFTIRKLNE